MAKSKSSLRPLGNSSAKIHLVDTDSLYSLQALPDQSDGAWRRCALNLGARNWTALMNPPSSGNTITSVTEKTLPIQKQEYMAYIFKSRSDASRLSLHACIREGGSYRWADSIKDGYWKVRISEEDKNFSDMA